MVGFGRPDLRNLFDGAPTPHIAHPPRTHHRDFYVATDGSFGAKTGHGGRGSGDATGGLGVLIETRDGRTVERLSVPDRVPDNNVAEYRALHLGLDVLAARSPADASVGVLVDHDQLAANVNAHVLASRSPGFDPSHPVRVPDRTGLHWRGIRTRIRGFGALRAARIESGHNPAHPLANAPDEYAHVNEEPDRCVLPGGAGAEETIPPPSRANRGASD